PGPGSGLGRVARTRAFGAALRSRARERRTRGLARRDVFCLLDRRNRTAELGGRESGWSRGLSIDARSEHVVLAAVVLASSLACVRGLPAPIHRLVPRHAEPRARCAAALVEAWIEFGGVLHLDDWRGRGGHTGANRGAVANSVGRLASGCGSRVPTVRYSPGTRSARSARTSSPDQDGRPMTQRLVRRLVRLYPRAWRARYED